MKKGLCVLLALLMFVSLCPSPAEAAPTLYFSAVNDTLLDLSDETMPLWSGGRLYVSYASAWKTDLGISYSYNKSTKKAIFYYHQNVLVCDLEKNKVTDNDGGSYAGAPLDRGGLVFVPIDALTAFFGLNYSYTKMDTGYLVRIKNGDVILTDERFIEAASAPIAQRYERYMKAYTEQTTPPPSEVTPPSAPERRSTDTCLAVHLTDAAAAGRVMDAMGTNRVTFLYSGGDGLADALRRAAATGCTVALAVSDGTAEEEIAALNEELWELASIRTRFVYVKDGSEETLAALSEKGWCCIAFAADLSATNDTARLSSRILSAAERRAHALVLLGEDTKMQTRTASLLRALREGNCRSVRLRETYL